MANSKYARQAKRWLATNNRKWIRLRALVLSEEPFCRVCLQEGVMPPSVSSTADHIDGNAATEYDFRRENIQGICTYHHGLKSIFEDGGFGGTREKAAKQGCDANGVPLDANHHWKSVK